MSRTYALLVVATTSLLALTACSSDGSDGREASVDPAPTATSAPSPPAAPAPSTTPPPATTTETPKPSQVINYETDDANGVTITTAADTAQLSGAPQDFKTFIAAELAKDQSAVEDGCTEKPQIYVSRLDVGGWAAGGHFVPQCGGYATLWAKTGGTWSEVWGGQQLTDCATLEKYAFPTGVVGTTCLDGDDERPYAG